MFERLEQVGESELSQLNLSLIRQEFGLQHQDDMETEDLEASDMTTRSNIEMSGEASDRDMKRSDESIDHDYSTPNQSLEQSRTKNETVDDDSVYFTPNQTMNADQTCENVGAEVEIAFKIHQDGDIKSNVVILCEICNTTVNYKDLNLHLTQFHSKLKQAMSDESPSPPTPENHKNQEMDDSAEIPTQLQHDTSSEFEY